MPGKKKSHAYLSNTFTQVKSTKFRWLPKMILDTQRKMQGLIEKSWKRSICIFHINVNLLARFESENRFKKNTSKINTRKISFWTQRYAEYHKFVLGQKFDRPVWNLFFSRNLLPLNQTILKFFFPLVLLYINIFDSRMRFWIFA